MISNDSNRQQRRLYRTYPRVIGGVCAGLADYFGLDTTLLRIIALLLILFGGISIWVYVILWIIIPSIDRKRR